MANNEKKDDIAGKEYWDNTWKKASIPKIIDPHDKSVKNIVNVALNNFYHTIFNTYCEETSGKLFFEVGCGNSAFLPYMNKEFGFQVSGLDYSEIGCEMTKKAAAHYGVDADIYLCDMFDLPDNLCEKYDIVFAAGVIEHFAETYKPCKAMAELAKPGGIIINIIPNFSYGSVMGEIQKKYAPDIYDKHMILDRKDLILAHEKVNIKTLYCNYLLAYNYGVLNFGGKHAFLQKIYRGEGVLKMLLKKDKLTGTQKYAPYIVYVGQKI